VCPDGADPVEPRLFDHGTLALGDLHPEAMKARPRDGVVTGGLGDVTPVKSTTTGPARPPGGAIHGDQAVNVLSRRAAFTEPTRVTG
jgi:hypothetical protein